MNRTSDITLRLAAAAMCSGLMIGSAGCHHRTVVAPLPTPQTPVEIINAPADDKAPVLEAPQTKLPPVPVSAAAAKPKREKKHSSKVSAASNAPEPGAASPATTASSASGPQETNTIGSLTTGAPMDPQARQEAADLIAAIEKRLNAMPAQMDEVQRTQVNKIRNFWRDAQEALKSGDIEGAMTLATKAKLLLDDEQQ